MKELNDYKIINADGASKKLCNNEGKLSFSNDKPNFVKESMSSDSAENFRVEESYSAPKQESSVGKRNASSGSDTSSATSSASSSASSSAASTASSASTAASSAASTAASAASSIGSSIGAMAGMVASSVATVAMVVVVFVSSLVINLSLAMADMHSLVFSIEMTGAQAEDFEDPIWAILTSSDGTRREQEVLQDTVLLTFDDLTPGTEYIITIKNSEKVFVEKSFFTATTPVEKGEMLTSMDGKAVTVTLKGIKLGKGEYYTLLVKDTDGKNVFSKDGVDPDKIYTFTLDEPKSLFFSLSVGGKSIAVSEIKYTPAPVAHVHDYGDLIAAVPATCETPGKAAYYYCASCGKYFDNNKDEVSEDALVIPALGHDYGDLVVRVAPSCETPGMAAHYYCAKCGKYFDENKNEVNEDALVLSALGHDYGEPEFIWTPIYEAAEPTTSDEPSDPSPTPVIDGDVVLISADMVPANGDHPTADLFEGFVSLTAEQVAHLEISTSGNVYVIYAFDEGGFYVGQYIDGVWDTGDDNMYPLHDMETTNANLRNMVEEGVIHFAYPVSVPATEEPSDPPVAESMALNLADGNIVIYSDGYVQNGDFHAFVSTDSSRYRITGSRTGDRPLMISTKTYNDLIPAGTTSIYVIFDNMTLTGSSWCSALCIDAYSDLDLYVENVGTTTIRGDNHPAFAVGQESGSITIAITSDGGFETFRCERDDESTPTVYGSGAIQSVTMNGIDVDGNGGSLEPSPAEVSDGPLTIVGYTAIARFTCHNDPTHVVELEAIVTYIDTPATCETDAYRTYTATVLFGDKEYTGNRITTFEDTALGHSVSDWIVTLEPTCTEKGSRHKVCTVCGDELEIEELDALGHDCGDLIPEEFDCEYGGAIEHFECSRCHRCFDLEGKELSEEDLILPAGHVPGELFSEEPADCVTDGHRAFSRCIYCEQLLNEDGEPVGEADIIIPKLAEGYDLTKLTSGALSEDLVGERVYLKNDSYGVKIGANGNATSNLSDLTAFVITSVSGSNVVLYYEEGDGYLSSGSGTISFLGTSEQPISVASGGYLSASGYFLMSNSFEESVILTNNMASGYEDIFMYLLVPAGHTYGDLIAAVPATCETPGKAAHYYCASCGKYFDIEKNEVNEYSLTIAALGHDYGDLIPTVPATCETPGKAAHYYCASCGKYFDIEKNEVNEYSLTIAALGHDWDEPVFTWTRGNDGYTVTATFTCLNCSHVREVPAEVELNGSTYVATVAFEGEIYTEEHTAPDLSVANGRIYIRPNDYIQNSVNSGYYTSFVSSENDPYVISGETPNNNSPQVVDIFNFSQYSDGSSGTYDGRWNDSVEDYYLFLEDLKITQYIDYPVFNIRAEKGVNLHVTLGDNVSFSGKSIFRVQAGGQGWTPTVNIYVDTQEHAFENAAGSTLYIAENGVTVNLYLDGVLVDATGNPFTMLDVSDGNIMIYSDGYTQDGTFHSFMSTDNSRYVITGSAEGDRLLEINTNDHNGMTPSGKTSVYLVFDNLTMIGEDWASALCIDAYSDLDLYIQNVGTTTITGYNHPAFAVKDEDQGSVKIAVTSEGGFDTFICDRAYRESGDEPGLYDASCITFTMNGVAVDGYGNS